MNKQKIYERGITLVALVVTIIVLLILAGITIGAVTSQGGIFGRAKNSADTYRVAATNENGTITGYENEIDKAQLGTGGTGDNQNNGNSNTSTGGNSNGGNSNGGNKTGEDPAKPDIDNSTIDELLARVKDNKMYVFNNMGEYIPSKFEPSSTYDGKVTAYTFDEAKCTCKHAKDIFDKAVEMNLVQTYDEKSVKVQEKTADTKDEITTTHNGKTYSNYPKEAMIVPITEPSMVLFEFCCRNEEQVPEGVIPMALSINYVINVNNKAWVEEGKPDFNKPGGDFEYMMTWLGDDFVKTGYATLQARATLDWDISIKALGQKYHYTVKVLTQTNFRKAMQAWEASDGGVDISKYDCIHPTK